MIRNAISTRILYPLATFALGLTLGAFALGERLPSQETRLGGIDAATVGALSLVSDQASPPVRLSPETAPDTPPSAAAAAALDSHEEPAPVRPTATGANDPQRLQKLEEAFGRLSERILLLEQAVSLQRQQAAADPPDKRASEEQAEEQPADTAERRQEALVAAGVDQDLAADIVWRQSQRALDRLEIQDLARREGWFGSDRYFDELRDFEAGADDLRAEIGDAAYDHYLYTMGKSNRVMVDSIIQGSPAEQAGLAEGDVIISYADERLFGWSELREATAAGERGETVHVRVMRGQDTIDFFMPRGPLGVRLDTTTMEPLE